VLLAFGIVFASMLAFLVVRSVANRDFIIIASAILPAAGYCQVSRCE